MSDPKSPPIVWLTPSMYEMAKAQGLDMTSYRKYRMLKVPKGYIGMAMDKIGGPKKPRATGQVPEK